MRSSKTSNAIGRCDRGYWVVPVVGETYDGSLHDISGFHVRDEHVFQAIANASNGAVAEGNISG